MLYGCYPNKKMEKNTYDNKYNGATFKNVKKDFNPAFSHNTSYFLWIWLNRSSLSICIIDDLLASVHKMRPSRGCNVC